MIYVVGDSHAIHAFKDIEGITVFFKKGLTMQRIGHLEDTTILEMTENVNFKFDDIVIFCFGEIDIRTFTRLYLTHHKNSTKESLLQKWVNNYSNSIQHFDFKEAKKGIMSVSPPITFDKRDPKFAIQEGRPYLGSDAERAEYTKIINEMLKKKCKENDWIYLDVYSKYVDENGLLPDCKTDGDVHIDDRTEIKKLLKEMNLI